MYGIVHGIWSCSKIVMKKLESEARKERNRIIHKHVKTGHWGRLKHCLDVDCSSLQSSLPELQEQPERQLEARAQQLAG
jgi:hypothetical protein